MTACPYQSRIQAYLDGELPREERKELALHVESCSDCRSALHSLKRLRDWTESALHDTLSLPPQAARVELDVDAAWTHFQTRLAAREVRTASAVTTTTPTRRSWTDMAIKTKKWLVGTAAAAVLFGSLAIPAVQAKADEVLSLFRAERIQTIQVTQEDIAQMQNWISSGKAGEMNLQGLGKVWSTDDTQAETTYASAAEAKAAGFAQETPEGYRINSVTVRPEHTLHFQLNVEHANTLLKQLGSSASFDANLNDQDFSVQWPQTVITTLASAQDGNQQYRYTAFASPHLAVPRGVDVNQLRETILQLPMLPENIRKQLASIEDWQTTLPVPTFADSGQNITKTTVNGNEGLFITNGHEVTLYWQEKGQVHLLESLSAEWNANTQDTLQRLAKAVK